MTADRSAWRVVLAGGGTGGHLYPGIAVAREIVRREPSAGITFVGTSRGLEARVVPKEGFGLALIRSGGIKGKSAGSVLRGLMILPASAWDAWRAIGRLRPHLVIGLGGYSSGPVVLLAALRGIPTMLLEQNAVPGLTNRLLGRVVKAAAVTYDVTRPFFGPRGFVSGNPVRAAFFASDVPSPADARSDPATRVLVFGGSQGAHAINEAMMQAAPQLKRSITPLTMVHQTGERDVEPVRRAYRDAALDARVEPYLNEMDKEMRAADVLVCRAGATTLAEIAAAGRAAILVPLPTATDDHQRKNAEVLERAGAAELIHQRDLTGDTLSRRLLALAADPARRSRMAHAVRAFARPDAAKVIVDRALQLARSRAR